MRIVTLHRRESQPLRPPADTTRPGRCGECGRPVRSPERWLCDGCGTPALRLVIAIRPQTDTPRQLRSQFAGAIRAAILRAFRHGRLDVGQAEECWRVVPDQERA
jgi:hypothetical protein